MNDATLRNELQKRKLATSGSQRDMQERLDDYLLTHEVQEQILVQNAGCTEFNGK